jgi:thiol-disulfide isomerase/thioredoxin
MANLCRSESRYVPRVQPRLSPSAGLMRRAVSACFGIGLLVLLTSCGGAERAAGSGVAGGVSQAPGMSIFPVNRRTAAPALSGVVLGGGRITLAQLRGRVVVLNAWGSWCAPCRAEAPTLESVYRQTSAKGVSFLGINVRDNNAAARAFQRTFGITYPSIPDTDGQVIASFRQLPPNAIPTTLVLDRCRRC